MTPKARWLLIAAVLIAAGAPPLSAASPSAVVLMYHRVGEEARYATSVSRAQFAAHLADLGSDRFAVLPLAEIVEALRDERALPARAVGLTLDDGYLSSYRNAWPALRKAGLPFTLFIATDHIDRGLKGYMSWDQLRALSDSGLVTIGVQGRSHAHLTALSRREARADIRHAIARVEAELGRRPAFFSYPYGEYGSDLRDLVENLDFLAAFGQQSGALDAAEDRFALPRFALSARHGDPKRLRRIAQALPLPASKIRPRDLLLSGGANPPTFGFTLAEPEAAGAEVACYFEGKALALKRPSARRIEARLPRRLEPGRHRINCTQPGPEGRWRWRGALFTVPRN